MRARLAGRLDERFDLVVALRHSHVVQAEETHRLSRRKRSLEFRQASRRRRMRHAYTFAPAYWAHHSWLEQGQPVRDERTARAAHAFLFTHYPQLVQVALADVPPSLPIWPRPACARLCRIVAALAFAPSLRRVVASQARAAFAAGVAPRLLGEIQRHPRAGGADLNV